MSAHVASTMDYFQPQMFKSIQRSFTYSHLQISLLKEFYYSKTKYRNISPSTNEIRN